MPRACPRPHDRRARAGGPAGRRLRRRVPGPAPLPARRRRGGGRLHRRRRGTQRPGGGCPRRAPAARRGPHGARPAGHERHRGDRAHHGGKPDVDRGLQRVPRRDGEPGGAGGAGRRRRGRARQAWPGRRRPRRLRRPAARPPPGGGPGARHHPPARAAAHPEPGRTGLGGTLIARAGTGRAGTGPCGAADGRGGAPGVSMAGPADLDCRPEGIQERGRGGPCPDSPDGDPADRHRRLHRRTAGAAHGALAAARRPGAGGARRTAHGRELHRRARRLAGRAGRAPGRRRGQRGAASRRARSRSR